MLWASGMNGMLWAGGIRNSAGTEGYWSWFLNDELESNRGRKSLLSGRRACRRVQKNECAPCFRGTQSWPRMAGCRWESETEAGGGEGALLRRAMHAVARVQDEEGGDGLLKQLCGWFQDSCVFLLTKALLGFPKCS